MTGPAFHVQVYARAGIPYVRPLRSLDGRFDAYRDALGPTSKYDKHERSSHVPIEDLASTIARLRGAGFAVQEHTSLAELAVLAVKLAASRETHAQRALSRAKHLYPYQRDGVAWLARQKAGLLADEMGLGKTVQVLLALPAHTRTLVVCPAVAIGTWEREIKKWRPDLLSLAVTRKGFGTPAPPYVGLISYDSLPFDVAPFPDTTLVADEAHAVKNPKSKRTRAFRLLASRVLQSNGRVWLLSGTPLENKPQELWHLLHAAGLAVRAFAPAPAEGSSAEGSSVKGSPSGAWENFVELFGGTPAGPRGAWVEGRELHCAVDGHQCAESACAGETGMESRTCEPCKLFLRIGDEKKGFLKDPAGKVGQFGMAWTLASPRIKPLLARVMLRRKRADVLPELPVKTYASLPCTLDPATLAACDAAGASFLRAGESAEDLHARLSRPAEFAAISALLEKLSTAKIPALLEHVAEFEEAGEPLVVFSPHRRPIEALGKRAGWATVLGDDSPDVRSARVSAFQAGTSSKDGSHGIAGTIGALGVSVTLTRASKVLFVGRAWNPEKNRQAEDRVCRIGQDRGVTVYDLVSDHALDARMTEVLGGKDALIESVLG